MMDQCCGLVEGCFTDFKQNWSKRTSISQGEEKAIQFRLPLRHLWCRFRVAHLLWRSLLQQNLLLRPLDFSIQKSGWYADVSTWSGCFGFRVTARVQLRDAAFIPLCTNCPRTAHSANIKDCFVFYKSAFPFSSQNYCYSSKDKTCSLRRISHRWLNVNCFIFRQLSAWVMCGHLRIKWEGHLKRKGRAKIVPILVLRIFI